MNLDRVGFYRVSYSSELFQSLTPALTSHTLSPRDRLGLQNDAFAMVCTTLYVYTLPHCESIENQQNSWLMCNSNSPFLPSKNSLISDHERHLHLIVFAFYEANTLTTCFSSAQLDVLHFHCRCGWFWRLLKTAPTWSFQSHSVAFSSPLPSVSYKSVCLRCTCPQRHSLCIAEGFTTTGSQGGTYMLEITVYRRLVFIWGMYSMFHPPLSLSLSVCGCRLGQELVVQLTYWLCSRPTLLRPATPSGRAWWVSQLICLYGAQWQSILLGFHNLPVLKNQVPWIFAPLIFQCYTLFLSLSLFPSLFLL